MNVTEKQKEMILTFMSKYPDFGRGRLRYNSENKRKIDGLWEQLATQLNTSGYGPRKSGKEWSKTWRDWKSNTLKKVAKHKAHMIGTGGGSPKNLQLSAVENALINFLTPDAAGLSNVPEGGLENIALSNNPRQDQYYSQSNFSSVQKEKILKEDEYYSSTLSSVEDESNVDKIYLSDSSEEKARDQILYGMSQTERVQYPATRRKQVRKKCETLVSIFDNDKQNMFENKENIQDKNNEMTPTNSMKYQDVDTKYSPDIKKPKLMSTAINLLEKKTSTSENIILKLLEIKREKLKLKKEELCIRKNMLSLFLNIDTTLSSLHDNIVGQYLTIETEET